MSIEILIFLAKLVIFSKKVIFAFFINLAWNPIKIILRFGFYKIVVKIYKVYLYILKKAGLSNKINSRLFLKVVNQKLAHFIIVALTILILSFNFANKTQAISSEELVGKTFLAELVGREFSGTDQLIEEYFDEESIILANQQTYLDDLPSIKSRPMIGIKDSVEAEPDDELTNLIIDGKAIVKPELAVTNKTVRARDGIVEYVIESGDSVSTIAEEFGISVNTILWENNLNAYSLIRPGNKLTILPVSGVSHKVVRGESLSKIANKYNIEEEKIAKINKLTDSSKLKISQKLIIPDGKKIRYAISSSKSYTGISAIKNLVAPASAKVVSGNKMNWPTEGHRITQYYSWRHHGLDIANKIGTPLYAADAGTIEKAGWNNGYGNNIIINHGGGKKTRYAHLSKFYVKRGDKVGKGEAIGAMGSTGWSTGSHLHFEVIINGRKYNPLNYIK